MLTREEADRLTETINKVIADIQAGKKGSAIGKLSAMKGRLIVLSSE